MWDGAFADAGLPFACALGEAKVCFVLFLWTGWELGDGQEGRAPLSSDAAAAKVHAST